MQQAALFIATATPAALICCASLPAAAARGAFQHLDSELVSGVLPLNVSGDHLDIFLGVTQAALQQAVAEKGVAAEGHFNCSRATLGGVGGTDGCAV
jgi:hypothetical protein